MGELTPQSLFVGIIRTKVDCIISGRFPVNPVFPQGLTQDYHEVKHNQENRVTTAYIYLHSYK